MFEWKWLRMRPRISPMLSLCCMLPLVSGTRCYIQPIPDKRFSVEVNYQGIFFLLKLWSLKFKIIANISTLKNVDILILRFIHLPWVHKNLAPISSAVWTFIGNKQAKCMLAILAKRIFLIENIFQVIFGRC